MKEFLKCQFFIKNHKFIHILINNFQSTSSSWADYLFVKVICILFFQQINSFLVIGKNVWDYFFGYTFLAYGFMVLPQMVEQAYFQVGIKTERASGVPFTRIDVRTFWYQSTYAENIKLVNKCGNSMKIYLFYFLQKSWKNLLKWWSITAPDLLNYGLVHL